MQKIVTSGNCLQFPETPEKFRDIFTERSAILLDFQQNLEKKLKICKMKHHQAKKFEIGAVQKSGNLVELERC